MTTRRFPARRQRVHVSWSPAEPQRIASPLDSSWFVPDHASKMQTEGKQPMSLLAGPGRGSRGCVKFGEPLCPHGRGWNRSGLSIWGSRSRGPRPHARRATARTLRPQRRRAFRVPKSRGVRWWRFLAHPLRIRWRLKRRDTLPESPRQLATETSGLCFAVSERVFPQGACRPLTRGSARRPTLPGHVAAPRSRPHRLQAVPVSHLLPLR
jgi:hypothetical protein